MQVLEIYEMVQGEGGLMGVPGILIRTSGCNLRCEYKDPSTGVVTRCDTPYSSWSPEKGDSLSVKEIVKRCKKTKLNHVVISGGEPYLQPDLSKVVDELQWNNFHVTIETNGTIYKENVCCDLYSVCPKLLNSIPLKSPEKEIHEKSYRNIENIVKNLMNVLDYQIKFVVNKAEDEIEIKTFIKKLNSYIKKSFFNLSTDEKIDPSKIYLMPEGIGSSELNKSAKICQEIAIRNNWRYSDRLHVRVWGHKRGV